MLSVKEFGFKYWMCRHEVAAARLRLASEKKMEAVAGLQQSATTTNSPPPSGEPCTRQPIIPIELYAIDNGGDTIPILVGSILAGLIVVVLIAYFIVRARRSKHDEI